MPADDLGEGVDVHGLDVGDESDRAALLHLGHVIGVPDHPRDLVTAGHEERGEQQGDAAVAAEDEDARHVFTLRALADVSPGSANCR